MVTLALRYEQCASGDHEVEHSARGREPGGDPRPDFAGMMQPVPGAVQRITDGEPNGAECQAEPGTDEHQSCDCEFGGCGQRGCVLSEQGAEVYACRQREEQGEPDASLGFVRPVGTYDNDGRKAKSKHNGP